MNRPIPVFSSSIDGRGHLSYGFSKEVIERLEGVVAQFAGTVVTKEQLNRIEHVLECELRKILWENDYDHSRGW